MDGNIDVAVNGNDSTHGGVSTFAWRGVSYGVGKPGTKKEKQILSDVSGEVSGGEVMALIGPSGAGKTSLLNVLAGRIRSKKTQRVSGQVCLDGKPLIGASLRKRIAYVMQQDLLCPTHTPREAVMFSAQLRLPKSISPAEKSKRVEDMLSSLGLLDCADTLIGDELIRGISGGEKKRTSIAIELVMSPRLIFLDEPTSGLDSFAAHSVCMRLYDLASKQGCNVLTTIHQPSSEVFHTFGKVHILCRGQTFFFGTLPNLSTALAAIGRPCPNEYNLADHAVFLVQTESDDELKKVAAAMAVAHPVPLASDALKVVTEAGSEIRAGAHAHHIAPSAGFFTQLACLTKREALSVVRNKIGLLFSVLVPVLLNLFFAGIFHDVGNTDAPDYNVNSHFGGLTQIAIGGMFSAAQPLLLRFPLDRGIFLREYATSSYGTIPYFLSKTCVELPQSFLQAVIVYLVTYFIMGMQGPFLIYVLVYWVSGIAASSTALLVGSTAANPEVAQQLSPAIFVPQLLFAGFFVRTEQIPVYLRWIQWICSLKYAMNLWLINEFGEATRASWTPEQQMGARLILERNSVEPELWYVYMVVLLGLVAAFRTLAIFALARRADAFF